MKTSNKLLITAGVILLGYLLIYNLALKAEYAKGEYRSRFYKMTKVDVKGFRNIHNNIGNVFGIDIEYGDKFAIWVKNDAKDDLKITNNGNTLGLDFIDSYKDHHYGASSIIIICPAVDSILFTTPKNNQWVDYWRSNTLSGFRQAFLNVRLEPYTKLTIDHNDLGRLDAFVTGSNKGVDEGLILNKNNKIKTANLKTNKGDGYAHFELADPAIDQLTYDVSDSARINITGKLLQLLKR